ncbi:MAG TPA: GDSL-type esterase/lipase family protein [Hyphomonadaceae bacterium]|nr:GDSL-type esterase/lipase family protein [Hyphomonadaceae bacterium]
MRLSRLLLSVAALSAATPAMAQGTGPAPVRGSLSPDSWPACANAPPTQEDIDKYMAERAARQAKAPAERPPMPPATEAIPIRAGAMPKHECFLKVAQRGAIDLLFVGDSITDFFGRADRGRDVWTAHYGALKAANFGISGDTTQDVLWRMRNGELAGFKAKAIVLMLGTNNIGRNDNSDIAAGDAAIVAEFRKHQPQAKILLLGVFPRGDKNGSARKAVAEINNDVAKLADGKAVFYLDIAEAFLSRDGDLVDGIMVDGLHPSPAGYEAWAKAMAPTLERLLAP